MGLEVEVEIEMEVEIEVVAPEFGVVAGRGAVRCNVVMAGGVPGCGIVRDG